MLKFTYLTHPECERYIHDCCGKPSGTRLVDISENEIISFIGKGNVMLIEYAGSEKYIEKYFKTLNLSDIKKYFLYVIFPRDAALYETAGIISTLNGIFADAECELCVECRRTDCDVLRLVLILPQEG